MAEDREDRSEVRPAAEINIERSASKGVSPQERDEDREHNVSAAREDDLVTAGEPNVEHHGRQQDVSLHGTNEPGEDTRRPWHSNQAVNDLRPDINRPDANRPGGKKPKPGADPEKPGGRY